MVGERTNPRWFTHVSLEISNKHILLLLGNKLNLEITHHIIVNWNIDFLFFFALSVAVENINNSITLILAQILHQQAPSLLILFNIV